MDLLHRFFDEINPRSNLLDKDIFMSTLDSASPLLLYAIYANVERLDGDASSTFFRIARNMIASKLEEASYYNIVALELMSMYAGCNL